MGLSRDKQPALDLPINNRHVLPEGRANLSSRGPWNLHLAFYFLQKKKKKEKSRHLPTRYLLTPESRPGHTGNLARKPQIPCLSRSSTRQEMRMAAIVLEEVFHPQRSACLAGRAPLSHSQAGTDKRPLRGEGQLGRFPKAQGKPFQTSDSQKSGPQTSSSSSTWELARNTNHRMPCQTY